jgi:hypothetical protein
MQRDIYSTSKSGDVAYLSYYRLKLIIMKPLMLMILLNGASVGWSTNSFEGWYADKKFGFSIRCIKD